MRRFTLLTTLLVLAPPAVARAAEAMPFSVLGCVAREGVRFCEGSIAKAVPTFDGVPLDVNVTLPAKPATGPDGDFPLIIMPHGFAGQKRGFDDPPPHEGSLRLARRGYAVLAPTARGFHGSCGTLAARSARPAACGQGWIHLADIRYEVRDLQFLAGRLVDEGFIDPERIGVFADSYGGAPSLALAILRDKVMLGGLRGEQNGRLVPWKSPRGTPMRIQAAAPYQTWSDLPNALLPNGRALDYTLPRRDDSVQPVGVPKLSVISGLFVTGQLSTSAGLLGYFAPPGVDPRADITSWLARMELGEPYDEDPNVATVLDELRSFRSPLHLSAGVTPAPLLISSGWTDDLFTVMEAVRVRNVLRARYPRAPVALWLADFGHQRGSNKKADIDQRQERILDWLDYYVRGVGRRPFQGIEARTHTCPAGAPSGGPFRAPTWAELHPGEVRLEDPQAKTILSVPGDITLGLPIDPVVAGNNPCATTPAADQALGVATYRLPAATGPGYTLLGSPTVIARYAVTGVAPQVAARLWDVAPDGNQTLVARGVYRPRGGDRQVFQLSPGARHFAAGHVPKLELLGQDAPYLRPSNGVFTIAAGDVDVRLPVRERPGTAAGVGAPAPLFLPPGARVAQDAVPLPRIAVRVRYAPRARGARCHRWARLHLRGEDLGLVRRMSITRNSRLLARKGRRPWSILLRRAGRRTVSVQVKVRFRVEETARFDVRVRYCR